ncbi:hypothetical protein ACA910_011199 [Epithemia clementina (nom. ined.)]
MNRMLTVRRLRLLFCTLLLVLVQLPLIVDAKCTAKDRNGQHVSLHSPPKGVEYHSDTDTLHCVSEHSCREWKISSCHYVRCLDGHSCQSALFRDNNSVSCYHYAACQDAQFPQSHAIFCGMHSTNSCMNAYMETDKSIICIGRHACVSDENTRITAKVGAVGLVKCTHGAGAYSCQHLLVLVNHAKRACFARVTTMENSIGGGIAKKDQYDCAVICEGDYECDEETIQFRVVK